MGKDKLIYLYLPMPKATATAKNTAAKVKKPVKKAVHKAYTKPRFFRPKTKNVARKPKLMRSIRKTVGKYGQTDLNKVILFPVTSDKNVQRMGNENTLTFIVALSANKSHIKKSFETLLNVKVRSVNTMIRPDGKKKAYIRLAPNHDSLKVASKIGIL